MTQHCCVGVVCVYVPVAKFEGQLRKFISDACDSKCEARRLLHHLPPVVEAASMRLYKVDHVYAVDRM